MISDSLKKIYLENNKKFPVIIVENSKLVL